MNISVLVAATTFFFFSQFKTPKPSPLAAMLIKIILVFDLTYLSKKFDMTHCSIHIRGSCHLNDMAVKSHKSCWSLGRFTKSLP